MESKSSLQLADFDWSFKYILGSSSLSTLELPFVNLVFHLTNDKKSARSVASDMKSVSLELDQQELKFLILKLDNANHAVKTS
ncbi:COMM domain-containing protein 8 isoform X2 [Bemisia tabaci]|uniref:COMM domain-containing protein 8 isoform X2 n=1 Tax=Bemisia tabaci TaxID=7038 RepID=UPI003B283963